MENSTSVDVNREYKDRLFNFIFGREENREWTLSLYNAINESDHTDASLIEFNTLGDVVYMGMKNDTSFILSNRMSVYEHQSSYNPNMPVRMLEYVAKLYSGYIAKNKGNKYGSTQILLPVPKLVVFYNGTTDKDDEVILKLSDAFNEVHRTESDIEVRVRMLNVNFGHNSRLMEGCRPLMEYSWFVDKIREYQKDNTLEETLNKTVCEIPEDFKIRDFLVSHMEEIKGMLDTEYNEAEVNEAFKEEGRAEERVNTDRERKRAEAAEADNERLRKENERLRALTTA